MRVGIDTYSYHRLLGQLRAGETPSAQSLPDGGPAAVRLSVELGVDVVSIQSCFLPEVDAVDIDAIVHAANGRELIVAWGAPDGLAYGTAPAAVDDAVRWLDLSASIGSTVMRIVLGGPRLRGLEPMEVRRPRVVPQLRALAVHADFLGIRLAIENHGEITATELHRIITDVDHPTLGVCFDTANAVRVGDDPVTAARLLAERVWMIHLKDIESLDAVIDPVAGPRSVQFGTGIVPVGEVLDTLSTAIRDGAAVCVELGQIADGTDEVRFIGDSIAWLRTR